MASMNPSFRNLPSFERVRELFSYDPNEGKLRWRVDRNQMKAGDIAGAVRGGHGYVQVSVDGTLYRAHRIIWLWMTGGAPEKRIDHADMAGGHNSWDNLRLATPSQNAANSLAHIDSKSGIKGIRWDARRRRWEVQVSSGQRRFHRRARTLAGAIALHRFASCQIFGKFARTR